MAASEHDEANSTYALQDAPHLRGERTCAPLCQSAARPGLTQKSRFSSARPSCAVKRTAPRTQRVPNGTRAQIEISTLGV